MAETRKLDPITVVAVVGGIAGLGLGIYLVMKKPAGVEPGGKVKAKFSFDYQGPPYSYILQVSLGNIIWGETIFDHLEGMTWQDEIELPGEGHYEHEFDFRLPAGIKAKSYDAEAGIKLKTAGLYDFLIKVVAKDAVNVRE